MKRRGNADATAAYPCPYHPPHDNGGEEETWA